MPSRRAAALAGALLVIGLITGCSSASSGSAGGSASGSSDSSDSSDTAGDEGGSLLSGAGVKPGTGDLSGQGMPDVPLENCEKIVDTEWSSAGGRSLWAFQLECTTRDAFDDTTANLLAEGFSLESEMSMGSESSVLDRNHFLSATDVGSLEVDVNLTGSQGAFVVDYIVTETRPE